MQFVMAMEFGVEYEPVFDVHVNVALDVWATNGIE